MRRWHGLRQDSGDPFLFGPRAKRFYDSLNIDPSKKAFVYSDALDVDKVLRLKAQCNDLGLQLGIRHLLFMLKPIPDLHLQLPSGLGLF